MTSLASPPAESAAERRVLEELRARYEQDGFDFVLGPSERALPDFMGSYVPDAVALKAGRNVAIEVKTRGAPAQAGLAAVSRLFETHPDWQLHVVLTGEDPMQTMMLPSADATALTSGAAEIRALLTAGYHRPAFVAAWSLLEAALREVDGETYSRPLKPGTVVQSLAMQGFIDPAEESRLRTMIALRNRIVHGGYDIDPSPQYITFLLSVVEAVRTSRLSDKRSN